MFDKKIKVKSDNSNFPTEIRSMTYGQLKDFRKAGLDPRFNRKVSDIVISAQQVSLKTENEISFDDIKEVNEATYVYLTLNANMVDWILEKIYPDFDFYDADEKLCGELAAKVYKKTIPSEAEVKN